MADPRHALGLAAEQAVAAWLTSAGWRVVARRTRPAGGGEIDLLVIDPADTLVAVEVRARRSSRTGAASATVDRRRVDRLRRALVVARAARGLTVVGFRVDLVTVEPAAPGRWRLTRLPGIG